MKCYIQIAMRNPKKIAPAEPGLGIKIWKNRLAWALIYAYP